MDDHDDDSDSSDDQLINPTLQSYDGVERCPQDLEPVELVELKLRDHVAFIMKSSGRKGRTFVYMAKILTLEEEDLNVLFMKRQAPGLHVYNAGDTCWVPKKDIAMKVDEAVLKVLAQDLYFIFLW